MCLRSVGSARNRSTPEGAERRRTGCGRTSMVLLLLGDVAVCRAGVWEEAMLIEFDKTELF